MGRNRTPTAVLELKGAFKKNPQRKAERANEPVAIGVIGDPSKTPPTNWREIWHEISGLMPAGVLTSGDRIWLEVVSRLVGKLRQDCLSASELANLMSSLSKLGMNPCDRSRISVPKQAEEKNPFAEFVQ